MLIQLETKLRLRVFSEPPYLLNRYRLKATNTATSYMQMPLILSIGIYVSPISQYQYRDDASYIRYATAKGSNFIGKEGS